MDEKWMAAYEKANLDYFDGEEYEHVGYISYVVVRSVTNDTIELSWYPNGHNRYHEVRVRLPRSGFVNYVDQPGYGEKPHLFVTSEWMESLSYRNYCLFALVDAIDVKDALTKGTLTQPKLTELRRRVDEIAELYPETSFVSFADSLLLKTNWTVGTFDSRVNYTYKPEDFLEPIAEVRRAFKEVLSLESYAVLSQGSNEYYSDPELHISSSKNHISLNSLGLPFAQLRSIDESAHRAIKNGIHGTFDLYMDEEFYHSLRFEFGFDKNAQPTHEYPSSMSTGQRCYVMCNFELVVNNLESKEP
jgi:hypothetical protein